MNALLNHKRDKKGSIDLEGVVTIRIRQQEQGIDVLARINDRHVLLIEDKTDTADHSGQLERYYGDVVERRTSFGEVLETDLRPIYLKTGNQSLADDYRIEKKGYKVFNRKDFLNVLESYEGNDSILSSFRQYLKDVEDRTNNYIEWTREDNLESWKAWKGFYRWLERKLEISPRRSGWQIMPNPSDGLLGLWWRQSHNDELYLQIEALLKSGKATDTRLCFKVDSAGKSGHQQQGLKQKWHDLVRKAGQGRVVRPRVMRIGRTMTVGRWKDAWMAFGEDDKLNMSGTVEKLKEAEEVLKAAISSGS